MLAASGVRSNVPPQNLKATPVAAVATPAAHRLGKHRAMLVTNANPAEMAQHETAGQEPGRAPLAPPVPELEAALTIQPEAAIPPIGAPQPVDVVSTCHEPQTGRGQSRQQGHRHCQYQYNTRDHETET